jgi:hypothetical protein
VFPNLAQTESTLQVTNGTRDSRAQASGQRSALQLDHLRDGVARTPDVADAIPPGDTKRLLPTPTDRDSSALLVISG